MSKRGVEEKGSILRLNVQERVSGCPLWDRIYDWKEDQHNPSNVAALVQFFFQFAREVDKGDVRRVVFGKSETSAARPSWTPFGGGMATGSINNKIRGAGRRKSGLQGQAIEMYAVKNEQVFVAVFVDRAFGRARAESLVAELERRFAAMFDGEMRRLQERFLEASKNPEQANLDHSFMEHFTGFGEVAEKAAAEHCQMPRAAAAAPLSSPSSRQ